MLACIVGIAAACRNGEDGHLAAQDPSRLPETVAKAIGDAVLDIDTDGFAHLSTRCRREVSADDLALVETGLLRTLNNRLVAAATAIDIDVEVHGDGNARPADITFENDDRSVVTSIDLVLEGEEWRVDSCTLGQSRTQRPGFDDEIFDTATPPPPDP